MSKRRQPEGLARARAEREQRTLAQRNTVALERIADALERMLATNARVMLLPRPASRGEIAGVLDDLDAATEREEKRAQLRREARGEDVQPPWLEGEAPHAT